VVINRINRNPLNNPIFFREFVKTLNLGFDPLHDVTLIQDLCDKFNVTPENVMARLSLYGYYNTSSRTQ
jgi:hypothetical protein